MTLVEGLTAKFHQLLAEGRDDKDPEVVQTRWALVIAQVNEAAEKDPTAFRGRKPSEVCCSLPDSPPEPLTLEYVLDLLDMTDIPQHIRGFALESTAKLLRECGQDWVRAATCA
ncbi:MAG: hypothetical protein ACM3RP_05725 [Chitinophagales bacterium]